MNILMSVYVNIEVLTKQLVLKDLDNKMKTSNTFSQQKVHLFTNLVPAYLHTLPSPKKYVQTLNIWTFVKEWLEYFICPLVGCCLMTYSPFPFSILFICFSFFRFPVELYEIQEMETVQ